MSRYLSGPYDHGFRVGGPNERGFDDLDEALVYAAEHRPVRDTAPSGRNRSDTRFLVKDTETGELHAPSDEHFLAARLVSEMSGS